MLTEMKGFKDILLVFRFFMVLIYVALGVVILFSDLLPLPVNSTGRNLIGIVLILYGTFRIYAYFTHFKATNDEE